MELLEQLNAEQRRAVETTSGPLLILAGPGSGKTRVITYRIAHLLTSARVRPYNIVAVTFTNKAAREMLSRLQTLAPDAWRMLTIGTFHAVCARMLRRDGAAIGLDSGFSIFDTDDQLGLVRAALKELNLDEKRYAPRSMLSAISAAKSKLIGPLPYAEHASNLYEEVVARVYKRYDDLLTINSALDFDDLIFRTVRLFREAPDVLDRYQERYRHILVDEFQDTNVAQYALVKLLAAKHANVCVVGDPDQSIYGWRQADIRNILSFEHDFPTCQTIHLGQNYRSTKTILDVAQAVISPNKLRKQTRLWTDNGDGTPVTVFEAGNEDEEADYVVREIQRLVARGLARYGECAVMFRMNSQSRKMEEVFLRRQVPHRVIGIRFYQRREIKDLLAYLRVALNPDDSVNLLRVVNVPGRGIGVKTVSELQRIAAERSVSVYRAVALVAGQGGDSAESGTHAFTPRTVRQLASFASLVEDLRSARQSLGLVDLLKRVISSISYEEYLRDGSEEGDERWENVQELLTVAAEYAGLEPDAALESFLEEVALVSDTDEVDEKADAVSLITLHAAKGLEFPVVFIVGMEDGVMPHSRSFDDPERMEEERRLCYVGITRAKRLLYFTYAARRTLFGGVTTNTPSRYLADIPAELQSVQSAVRRAPIQRPSPLPPRPKLPPEVVLTGPPPRSAPPVQQFRPGDRVRHTVFGEGIVTRSVLTPTDEELEVAFPERGLKKLSAAYARLERVR